MEKFLSERRGTIKLGSVSECWNGRVSNTSRDRDTRIFLGVEFCMQISYVWIQ